MKTEIRPSGVLKIKADTELEAYALRKWAEENKSLPENIIIDYSFTIDCSQMNMAELYKAVDYKWPDYKNTVPVGGGL